MWCLWLCGRRFHDVHVYGTYGSCSCSSIAIESHECQSFVKIPANIAFHWNLAWSDSYFVFRPEISQADPYHARHLATRRGCAGRGYLRRRRGGQHPGPEIQHDLATLQRFFQGLG